ncbi:hypothetical protein, conserved [Eimeria tenella]|uniref:Uncharacterized protein n=1 Tax=Eimeria tenella TaxID=5802 RepID=U6KUH1_EIMTE|nr:hypothetical protein, conserved [Eimeria tenella]CDJ40563.1 hypothetical protein, conserved [Eimeria tenella]|eukprot:XP_013231313.1 hypothetical protein, conserved [Eimeria tenella]
MRKLGEATEFVYGLGISSLQPANREGYNEDTPLRFVSVQLQLPDSSKTLDVDIHAFLFEHDGTYVDCVFYKNPTLAGKSVRLLQQEQELLVDLRYIPQRCSFIVCTLAIYTGGTVAQLADGTVQLSALVPRAGLEEDTEFPHLPCGQIPPSSSDFYEWVCLGVLPLKPRSSDGEECGMMLCLLAQHGSFWYFKPVLKPVTAFTPQGLIEPAQDFVTKHLAGLNGKSRGLELGSLVRAALDGTHVELDLTDTEESATPGAMAPSYKEDVEAADLAGSQQDSQKSEALCATDEEVAGDVGGNGEPAWSGSEQQHDGFVPEEQATYRTGRGGMHAGVDPGKATGEQQTPILKAPKGFPCSSASAESKRKMAPQKQTGGYMPKDGGGTGFGNVGHREHSLHHGVGHGKRDTSMQKNVPDILMNRENLSDTEGSYRKTARSIDNLVRRGATGRVSRPNRKSKASGRWPRSNEAVNGEPLFTSFPLPNGYRYEQSDEASSEHMANGAGGDDSWKYSVERRLSALEHSVEDIQSDIQTIAAAASEMQKNTKVYLQELREKFTELKSDVASDLESALSGPLKALSTRVNDITSVGTDAGQFAEQTKKLWAVDRMVLLAERNWHLLAQSMSELRFQLSGLEQRIAQGAPSGDPTEPPTDGQKGLPVSLHSCSPSSAPRSQDSKLNEAQTCILEGEVSVAGNQRQSTFASKALKELSHMQIHAEAFGACLRQLASGTAPDGLKGLDPVERRVLSFAGTPKVFAALHELERALDTVNLCSSGVAGTRLY